ncbi:uncharacterized protein LOC143908658 [Temnothorax americanus]|uniref:uncharacterized protein LOC143908658 n=1 Tax=Temnothorax americanus TaxID=1964332 RepID=UPI004067633A
MPTCCDTCCKIQRLLYQNMDKLIKKVNAITNFICNKETYMNDEEQVQDITPLLPNFPLATVDDFKKFEDELQKDRVIRKQFKTKILKIGGVNFAKQTRNIVKYVLSDEICKKLSWTGQKGSNPVKDTGFITIITEYVADKKGCTLQDVGKVIQE